MAPGLPPIARPKGTGRIPHSPSRRGFTLCVALAVSAAGCGSSHGSFDAGRISGDSGAAADAATADGGSAADAGPSLAVTLTGSPRPLAPTDFGMNGSVLSSSQGWKTTNVVDGTVALAPGLLRFPEGGHACVWDWAHGWFFVNYEPRSTNTTGYDFTSYAQAASRIGNQTISCLDLVTRPSAPGSTTGTQCSYPTDTQTALTDQVNMIQAEKNAGIEVPAVELGNELYLHYSGNMMVDKTQVFPDGASYATTANTWIAKLHTQFSGIKVGLSLVNDFSDRYTRNCPSTHPLVKRQCQWDQEVLAGEQGADAGILHIYFESAATSPTVNDFLALPSHYWQQLSANGSTLSELSNKGMTAWITELNYNINDTGVQTYTGSWAHALGIASFDLLAFANPNVELIVEHNLYAGYPFGHLLATSWGHAGKPAFADAARAANGASYALIAAALMGETRAQGIAIAGAPTLEGYDAVVGLALGHGGSFDHVVVANLSNASVQLDLGTILGTGLSGTVLTPPGGDPAQIIPDATQDLTSSTPSTTGSVVTLPPYALADWHR